MADKAPPEGPELAAMRVKIARKMARKEQQRLLSTPPKDSQLIGQLKAAQSSARNAKLREKVNASLSKGRIEAIENQSTARAALRLESLLIDPLKQNNSIKKQRREISKILSNDEQYRVNRIMSDDSWGQRLL